MTLRQLQYFVAVVDAGLNITLAAEKVHSTQPGISKQLKQLEGAFGFELFHRRGKSLDALTEPGRKLLERARQVVDGAQALRALARSTAGESGNRLTLGASPSAARYLLPQPLAALEQRVRDLAIELQLLDTGEAVEALRRGSIDLAITSTTVDAPPEALALPLERWRRVALLPVAHPLNGTRGERHELPLSLAELARYPIVTYRSAQHARSSFQRAFAAHNLQPRVALAAADTELIKTYVRNGLGVGILAPIAVSDGLEADLLVRPIEAGLPACVTWLLLPPGARLGPEALALTELLGVAAEQLAELARLS